MKTVYEIAEPILDYKSLLTTLNNTSGSVLKVRFSRVLSAQEMYFFYGFLMSLQSHVVVYCEQADLGLISGIPRDLKCPIRYSMEMNKQGIEAANGFKYDNGGQSFETIVTAAGFVPAGGKILVEAWHPALICAVRKLKPGSRLELGPNLEAYSAEVMELIAFLPPGVILSLSNQSPTCCDKAPIFLPQHVTLDYAKLTDPIRYQTVTESFKQKAEKKGEEVDSSPQRLILEKWDGPEVFSRVSRLSPGKQLIIGRGLEDRPNEVKTLISLLPAGTILLLTSASARCCDTAIKFLHEDVRLVMDDNMVPTRLQSIGQVLNSNTRAIRTLQLIFNGSTPAEQTQHVMGLLKTFSVRYDF